MKKFLIMTCMLAIATGTSAQGTSTDARSKTQQATTASRGGAAADTRAVNSSNAFVDTYSAYLTHELGLDQRQAAQARELITRAEGAVADQRTQLERIRSQMDAAYEPFYQQLTKALNPEQAKTFATLRRNGGLDTLCGGGGCEHSGHEAGAKAAGCCAAPKSAGTAPTTFGAKPATPTRTR